MPKVLYKITIILLAIYVFIPEPTDAIPILGWLDEGTAIALVVWIYRNKIKVKDREPDKKDKTNPIA